MKKIRFIAALLCLFLVNVVPVSANEEAGLPKVIDDAELLSDAEEAELTEQINTIITQYQIDVVLAMENQMQEAEIEAEAERLYKDGGYGIGENKDGTILLLDMKNGQCQVSQFGSINTSLQADDLNSLLKNVTPNYFNAGQFGAGLKSFLEGFSQLYETKPDTQPAGQNAGDGNTDANEADELQKNQSPNNGTVTGNQTQEGAKTISKPRTPVSYIIPALICGLIISFICMLVMRSGMSTAYKQKGADVYRNADASLQIQKDEVYLTSSVTTKPLKKK